MLAHWSNMDYLKNPRSPHFVSTGVSYSRQREVEASFSSIFSAVHPILVLYNEFPLSPWFPSLHLTDWFVHLDFMHLVRALRFHKCLSLKDVSFSVTGYWTNEKFVQCYQQSWQQMLFCPCLPCLHLSFEEFQTHFEESKLRDAEFESIAPSTVSAQDSQDCSSKLLWLLGWGHWCIPTGRLIGIR